MNLIWARAGSDLAVVIATRDKRRIHKCSEALEIPRDLMMSWWMKRRMEDVRTGWTA